jgi:hypothetical protein
MNEEKLSEQERMRRQQIIDWIWEANLEQEKELARRASRTCHRGPWDSDWNIKKRIAVKPNWSVR